MLTQRYFAKTKVCTGYEVQNYSKNLFLFVHRDFNNIMIRYDKSYDKSYNQSHHETGPKPSSFALRTIKSDILLPWMFQST